ncbi:hypothetical protein BKA65DRAFT_552949 [Rhexocercosporidium sp. MPI-PUGE-AT-0058]|nr:hypothetical protein BKA65DRAFT_552949 [Rhexocercosporidium sp. MPI-PUGE-AT-0058]
MALATYSKAGLPDSILDISCQSLKGWKIYLVLSYYKIDIRKGSSKVELLKALNSFALTVSQREQQAIKVWLQAKHMPVTELAAQITAARAPTSSDNNTDGKVEAAQLPTGNTAHDPQVRECPVCIEELIEDSFLHGKITSSCLHKPTFCKNCLQRCVDTHIREHPWSKVYCPECREIASDKEVQNLASNEAFEIYQRNTAIAGIRFLPNFIMCLAPNCGSGQIHDVSDEQSIMTCSACGFKTCTMHMMPYHEGQTCAEYDVVRQEQVSQEAASKKFLSEETKVCPGPGCGIHTIKAGNACDHITCKQCYFDYCWICLVPYDMVRHIGGNAHAKYCHLWTDETPAQYKERKSVERKEAKDRKAGNSLKRKRSETEDVSEDESELTRSI